MQEFNRETNTICSKSNDIDVKFEDGTIVTNRNYQDFKSGEIRNPNVSLSSYSKKYHK